MVTMREVESLAGLADYFSAIRVNQELLTEQIVRNYCGNSFHPDLIAAALGDHRHWQAWLRSINDYTDVGKVKPPMQARGDNHVLKERVQKLAVQRGLGNIKNKQMGELPVLRHNLQV